MNKIERVNAGLNSQTDTAFNSKVVQLTERSPEWAAYDRLGPDLRKLLQDAPIDIDSREVEQVIDMFEEDVGRRGAEKIAQEMYRDELRTWCREYRASFNAQQTASTTRVADLIRT